MGLQDKLSEVERKVLAVVQKGFPESLTPYKDMAEEIGVCSQELLEILRRWRKQGKLRRVGAILHHVRLGLRVNAMVVWNVDPDRIEQIGALMVRFSAVSHVYLRKSITNWPYNLYTMIHCREEADLNRRLEKMSRTCGISDYKVLKTVRELKKVGPTYISSEPAEDVN